MVSDTRSARKIKDEADDLGSRRKVNIRKDSSMRSPEKADVSGVRRSARETSLSSQTSPSPQSTRKSKRLEKGMPPLTSSVKRKSERLEKYNTPSPVRRSDRGKKNLSSSSSGSKQSAKEPTLSELKRKKKKNLIQVTMESEKAELDLEAVGMKRKKMSGKTFKALFKSQRLKEIVKDVDGELEGPDKLSQLRSDNSRRICSEPIRNGEDVSDECSTRMVGKLSGGNIDRASDGALPEPICILEDCPADTGNRINGDPSVADKVLDEPCSKYHQSSYGVGERLPKNCSFTKNMDAPELGSSTCSARSRDSSVSPESKEDMHPKEATCSPTPKCKYHDLLGICAQCSKNKRAGYDSPEQELCSCSPTVDEDLGRFSCCQDRSHLEAAVTPESAKKCDCRLSDEPHGDSQMDGHESVCALCNKDGKLLFCVGKDCKRCYHPNCLDPPLHHALPGVWHCPECVKKKLLLGVHFVSEGVESIWDFREVEVSNAEGVQQRQYLVKYHGLAHVHNHWVPDKQLLLENPRLVSNFTAKDQIMRWSPEWTVPHRLLSKRSIQDKIYIASSAVISVCNNEWLVKWSGLSYEHATWELENAYFLSSSQGQNLMKNYESRRRRAKQEVDKPHKGSIGKLSELPAGRSHVNDNYVLQNVNKLRERLFKCQNAVIFDDQERAMPVIFSIGSMSEICWPVLIVTPSSSLSQWEAEFAKLVPSVDVVVYSGNKDARKGIISSEFYEEGGGMMLQVLLSSREAVSEDIDILRGIRWEAIVIDEDQHSGISSALEQIKVLATDSRILLVNGQMKDTTSEHLKILSLLESDGDFEELRGLKSETNDNLCKLRERLSRFIAYQSTSQVSKFQEYWVPVQISNYQLEQYCDTLLSNSIPLRSCLRNDPVGVLRDILLTVRKCCDHPYLLDSSLQERLIAEKRPATELLDIGIKASGKLQLLDAMLMDIKTRGLKVLVLYQLIIGSGGASTGDILDDFLRQRFGQNTYERVDAGIIPTKKQAAVNRFNKEETGQFVFLLENRACSSTIKLSSLDIIIIHDSDWNPANDLRALQKISIDPKVEQIKVFRLYSSFTVEERALVLAKQNLHLNNLQSRTTSDTLLSWGAVDLFRRLDEYHATDSNSTLALNFSSEQLLLNEVTKEFQAILSGNCDYPGSGSVISRVKLGVGSYITNIPLHGEAKVQLKDGEEPHVFWRNLLDGKNPQWRNLKGPSPRNRKRVHYLDESLDNAKTEKDDVVKKRRKLVNQSTDPAVELGAHEVPPVAVSKGGPSAINACNQSENLQRDGTASNNNPNGLSAQSSLSAEVSNSTRVSKERIVSSDEQKSLCSFLQGEMTRLCQILKLSEDVILTVRRFLEYVVKNHHVNSDSSSILQAFQISLCWIAASIIKQKIDKKDSLMLAKQLLNYQCTEEQVNSVYSKMRSLKRMYLQCSENTINLGKDCFSAEDDITKQPSNDNDGGSQFSPYKQRNVKTEIGEEFSNGDHAGRQILLQKKLALNDKDSASDIDNKIKKIQKKCDKRMKKLKRNHQEEIQEFDRIWEEKKGKLETDHKLESAILRSIHGQGSVTIDRLKLLDNNLAQQMEEHNLLKDMQLKDLEAKQLAEINEEKQKAANWLAEAKAFSGELRAVDGPRSLGSQSGEDVGGPQPSVNNIGLGNEFLMSGQHPDDQNPSKSSGTQENNFAPSVAPTGAPAEAVGCEAPVGNLVTVNLQNEVRVLGISTVSVVEHLHQSKHSSNKGETVCANPPASAEEVTGEIQSVDLSEELPTEVPKTLPNEILGQGIAPMDSDKGSKTALPDALVIQRDGPEEAANEGSQSPGQQLGHSEQTEAMPDSCDLLPQQVQPDKIDGGLVPAELQDLDEPAVENQGTSQFKVTSEPVDNAALSNIEAPVTDEIATTVPSNRDTPVTENPEERHCVPVDASLSCNHSPAIEDHDQQISPSQNVEPVGTEVGSPESISQSGQNLELPHHHLDVGPACIVAHGQSVGLRAISQNDVAVAQAVWRTVEQPNQAVPPLGMDAGRFNGPSYLSVHPTQQPSSWNPTPSLSAEPLQNELERIRKESEQLEKNHEDRVSMLKSDCEKEIQEIITQIRNKYELKLQESEAEYRLRRTELDKNQNIVLMNKVLAEAFRSKCLDLRPSGLPGVQEAVPSSFTQHLHQLSRPPSMRPPTGVSPSLPVPTSQQITTPALQTMPQLSWPQPQRSSSPVLSQNVVPPPVQSQRSSPVPGQNVAAPPVQSQRSSPVPGQNVVPPPVQSQRSSPVPGQNVADPPVQSQRSSPVPGPNVAATPVQSQRSSPVPGQRVAAPPVHSQRSSPVPGQNVAAPPVQAVQHTAAPFSGTSSRPPLISAITPAVNPRVGGEIRAPAPHLQPFRPAVPASTSPSVSQLRPQQSLPSQPGQLSAPAPPLPLQPHGTNLVSQNRPERQGGLLASPNPSLSRLGLIMDMDHRPPVPENHTSSPLPDICSTFHSLELYDLEILGNVQGGDQTSAAGANVVCLSDDD